MAPDFYYRPYHIERNFLRSYSGPLDLALLRARHLAPPVPGSQGARRGQSGRELVDAVLHAHRPFVIDVDTAMLAGGSLADLAPRSRLMASAGVLTLPLTPGSFVAPADRLAFGQVVIADQAGAAQIVAPYFRFRDRQDPWYRLNLQFVTDARALGDPRQVSAFINGTLSALTSGEVAASARDYHAAGAQRAFLRIAGFDPRQATTAEIIAYRRAVDAFIAAGVPPVADGVGRFGLVLIAAGAEGFSSGASHHHSVSPDLLAEEARGAGPTLYEVPDRWFAVPHDQARRDAAAGLFPACPHACNALAAGSGSAELKEHLIHYFTLRARAVALARPAAVRASLQVGNHSRAWVSAL